MQPGWPQNIIRCDPKIERGCFAVEDWRDWPGPDRKLAASGGSAGCLEDEMTIVHN